MQIPDFLIKKINNEYNKLMKYVKKLKMGLFQKSQLLLE